MAMPGSSCMMVEQKRDFDLSIVLDALRLAIQPKEEASADSNSEIPEQVNFKPSNDTNETPNHHAEATISGESLMSESSETIIRDFRAKQTASSLSNLTLSSEIELGLQDSAREVNVEDYLRAFTELTRFFKLTGPVFTFVARDLSKKITTVQNHMQSPEDGTQYITLRTMMEHELHKGTATHRGSGTRTMLRLHWAFEFIIEFMDSLCYVTNDTKTSKLVYDIYQRTLYKHHPWWTQKLAYLAVHTLPTIKALIDIMCKQDYSEVQVLLKDIVAVGRPILNYTSELYARHELSNIV